MIEFMIFMKKLTKLIVRILLAFSILGIIVSLLEMIFENFNKGLVFLFIQAVIAYVCLWAIKHEEEILY